MDYSAFHWSEKARKQAERAKEIVDSIGSVLHYKGGVATRADLPVLGQELGDMYNILSDGSNVVWNGSDWDDISGIVDLSAYRTASDQDTIDSGKVPTTRTVNGKALSSNISLTASDVGALPSSTTIGDATLTIQKNGTTVDTFTANATSNKTINITVPTNTSELTNGAGFITTSALNGYATQTWVGQQGFLTSTALSGYATETWVGQQGYITGITSSMVTSALGYTPYDASNPNGYTSNTGTVTSVNNVSPVSGNVTLSIPTVNNSTITITQGGVTKGSFTLNQSSGDTIALDAGGGSPLPSQTGNAGKFLTTDGTDASWGVPKTHNLFDFIWRDAELNDMSWLRADTFSWQDGTVYTNAYNHLVDDYNGGTSQTETVGSYTITYVLASDGHKITTDETNVANIYNESGVAWYYILDTANQRFKLPRTKYGFVGLRDTVGKYVPESLPNITGKVTSVAIGSSSTYSGALKTENVSSAGVSGSSSGANKFRDVLVDASLSSSTYQDNAPVQQRSTQMYLYFYVGQFTQSATEQTAGLNSELFNGKVDLNAANLSTAGKSLISGLGMPSNRYEDLTLGASGTQYTAPANGYYVINKAAATGKYIVLINTSSNFRVSMVSSNNNQCNLILPVKIGDIMEITYTAAGATDYFRFIYAEGEENV